MIGLGAERRAYKREIRTCILDKSDNMPIDKKRQGSESRTMAVELVRLVLADRYDLGDAQSRLDAELVVDALIGRPELLTQVR